MHTSKELEAIRVSAVDSALRLSVVKVPKLEVNIRTLLNDAEEIEKYTLGYELKPEGE